SRRREHKPRPARRETASSRIVSLSLYLPDAACGRVFENDAVAAQRVADAVRLLPVLFRPRLVSQRDQLLDARGRHPALFQKALFFSFRVAVPKQAKCITHRAQGGSPIFETGVFFAVEQAVERAQLLEDERQGARRVEVVVHLAAKRVEKRGIGGRSE